MNKNEELEKSLRATLSMLYRPEAMSCSYRLQVLDAHMQDMSKSLVFTLEQQSLFRQIAQALRQ